MTVQAILKALRREYWALKMAFAATATTIPVTTKTLSFTTSENLCRYVASGSYDYYAEEMERVEVTLDTSSGANTFAKLELSGNATDAYPRVRRIPYSGGARWIVTNTPRTSGGDWEATSYVFTVQTMVDGTLTAKMIWED